MDIARLPIFVYGNQPPLECGPFPPKEIPQNESTEILIKQAIVENVVFCLKDQLSKESLEHTAHPNDVELKSLGPQELNSDDQRFYFTVQLPGIVLSGEATFSWQEASHTHMLKSIRLGRTPKANISSAQK